jgi:hypothetical protein
LTLTDPHFSFSLLPRLTAYRSSVALLNHAHATLGTDNQWITHDFAHERVFLTADWQVDDAVAFKCPEGRGLGKGGSALTGCYVEIRSKVYDYVIDLAGRWKCHGLPSNLNTWYDGMPNREDSLGFVPAVENVGRNSLDSLSEDGYPFIGNVAYNSSRIWAAPGTPRYDEKREAFCVARVPRFCHLQLGDFRQCLAGMICTGSPGVCEYPPVPNVTAVTPEYGLERAGTLVRLSASNIEPVVGNVECLFDGTAVQASAVSASWIDCTTPSSFNASTVQVAARNNASYPSSLPTLPFTFYPIYSILSSQPGAGTILGGDLITVKAPSGSFLLSGVPYECFLGGDSLPATVVDSQTLECTTVGHGTGVFPVDIRVGSQFVARSPNTFAFEDDKVSPYCRLYRGVEMREFPFVGIGEQVRGGGKYLAQNVAFLATNRGEVSLAASPPAIGYNSSEVMDEDFCCHLNVGNLGLYCGSLWNNTGQQTEILVTFATEVVVNELLVSWSRICTNMPSRYELWAKPSGSGSWAKVVNRDTSAGARPCVSFPGDNGAVATCVDYFAPGTGGGLLRASEFSLRFNNTVDLPTNRLGSHLYEVAMQGVFADQAYSLSASGPAWAGSSQSGPQLGVSAAGVALPSFGLQVTSIEGNAVAYPDPYRSVGSDVTVDICRFAGPTQCLDVTAEVLGGAPATRPYSGSAFDDVAIPLSQATAGRFSVRFRGAGLFEDLRLPFEIVPGAASRLDVSIPRSFFVTFSPPPGNVVHIATRTADQAVELGPVRVCAQDAAGNPAAGSLSLEVRGLGLIGSSGSIPTVLSGETSAASASSPCATLRSLIIVKPHVGNHQVALAANVSTLAPSPPLNVNLTSAVRVDIGVGPAGSLVPTVTSLRVRNGQVASPSLDFVVSDGAGNPLAFYGASLADTNNLRAQVVRFSPATVLAANGTSAEIVNGVASFSEFSVVGEYGRAYTVWIEVLGFGEVGVPMQILRCNESSPFQVANALNTFECLCMAGFQPDGQSGCEPCPVNTFSAQPSDAQCVACPAFQVCLRSRS